MELSILISLIILAVSILVLTWTQYRDRRNFNMRTDFYAKALERLRNTLKRHADGGQFHWLRFNKAREHMQLLNRDTMGMLRKEFELKEEHPRYVFRPGPVKIVSTPHKRTWFESAWLQNPYSWSDDWRMPAKSSQAESRLHRTNTPPSRVYKFDVTEAEKRIIEARQRLSKAFAVPKHILMGVDLAREGSEDQSSWAYLDPDTGKIHNIPGGDFDKFFKDLQYREDAAKYARVAKAVEEAFNKSKEGSKDGGFPPWDYLLNHTWQELYDELAKREAAAKVAKEADEALEKAKVGLADECQDCVYLRGVCKGKPKEEAELKTGLEEFEGEPMQLCKDCAGFENCAEPRIRPGSCKLWLGPELSDKTVSRDTSQDTKAAHDEVLLSFKDLQPYGYVPALKFSELKVKRCLRCEVDYVGGFSSHVCMLCATNAWLALGARSTQSAKDAK